ncbi:MAG: hypothetical protein JO250_22725 [Armatimonadetes bacterium]|nr:hypothetical protein [Armatimonadota bacterium]
MGVEEFRRTLADATPPAGPSPALQALWLDGKGNWHEAHERLQDADDRDSAWVHAYLHRKEGDLSNAGYWYRRAEQPVASGPLEAEWESLVKALLASAG